MCVYVDLGGLPSACACVWVCLCSGFPQSHVWGMCCLCWVGGGGGARRQQSTKERLRQAGRQAAGRTPARAPQAPTPWLLKVEGVRVSERALCVFLCVESLEWTYSQDALGLDYLPDPSANLPSLRPAIGHPGHFQALSTWFSLKSNFHPPGGIKPQFPHFQEKTELSLALLPLVQTVDSQKKHALGSLKLFTIPHPQHTVYLGLGPPPALCPAAPKEKLSLLSQDPGSGPQLQDWPPLLIPP